MKFDNIYIFCPGNYKSGGPEVLHQLAYHLNKIKPHVAKIVYFNYKDKNTPYDSTLFNYISKEDYLLKEDLDFYSKKGQHNAIIFPETVPNILEQYHGYTIYFWWLSVDNFLYKNSFFDICKTGNIKHAIKEFLQGKVANHFNIISEKVDVHLCQSMYAKNYLSNKRIYDNVYMLGDYINSIYFNANIDKKDNIIVYNPKKGGHITQRIINYCKKRNDSYTWIPLINMSNDEILKILGRAKLYIDFGNHPGKDRFPREAALQHCCIITGKKGAAKNDIDIPIKNKYKFNDYEMKKIFKQISECMNEYEQCIQDFSSYRDSILNEQDIFIDQVYSLFNNKCY